MYAHPSKVVLALLRGAGKEETTGWARALAHL